MHVVYYICMYVFASPVHFISQKEICLGSMIVKSMGRILRDLFEKKSKIPEKVI